MTQKTANIFKGVILAFGLMVYAVAVALITAGREIPSREMYLWVIIGVVYLAFFIPALFNGLTFAKFAQSSAGAVLLWNADIVFCFVSIALALAVFYGRCPMTLAIVVELAMLFVALILVFISMMASGHVQSVDAKQQKLMGKINEMRAALSALNLSCASSSANDETKSKIKALAEDVRYLSPVDSAQSASLEGDILSAIDAADDALKAFTAGADEGTLKKSVRELSMKIAQRKLLRN